jgi:biofilm protein TabA
MILDSLIHSHLYSPLSPRFAKAFEYLNSTEIATLPPGKVHLDGEILFVIIQEYTTKPEPKGKWEAHRSYIDIQYLITGTEKIGYAPLTRMTPGEYNPAKDFLPLTGTGIYLPIHPGDFTIFFPHDAHMPGIALTDPTPVKKAVVKIAVD